GLLMKEQARLGDKSAAGLGMFDIAWIGVPAGILGIGYLLLCTKWLLPDRTPAMAELDDPREYTVEMIVTAGSPQIGKTIEEAGLRHLPGMYLMEIDRDGHVIAAVSSSERLQARDRLVFVGVVESVVDLRKVPGLEPADDHVFELRGRRSERCLIEAVVSSSCPFIRTSIREARFRSHYDAAVVAVARDGRRIRKKIGDIELLPGDTLLLEANPEFLERQRNSRDFFLVSQVADSRPPRHERAWFARVILSLMIVVVAFGLMSMLKAALLAAGLMIAARCCRGSEAKRAIDLSVLLTMAAGLGIGQALQTSGAAELLAGGLIGGVRENALLVAAMIYLITMIFTNLITAPAAAVLVFPIAAAAARELRVDVMPFAVLVMVAAAASFATPIGYQTNLMVYGPGGYRFGDYLRVGGPLSILVGIVAVLVVQWKWAL
ncbi:MAG: SLC13 family permease, partial [Planctomycetaceae bacterium]